MAIEVVKGFVSYFSRASGSAINGIGGAFFSVGEPPVNLYYLGFGSDSFSSGDYVAVACKRSLVVRGASVALAYRNLGDLGKAHFVDISYPIVFVFFGILGVLGSIFFDQLITGLKEVAIGLLVVGGFGLWRFWSMYKACRMLDLLPSTLSTYSQR